MLCCCLRLWGFPFRGILHRGASLGRGWRKVTLQAPRAPIQAQRAPIQAQRAPILAHRAPIQAPRAPIQAQKAPIQAQRAPIQAQRAPILAHRAPIQAPRAPIQAHRAPILAITRVALIGWAVREATVSAQSEAAGPLRQEQGPQPIPRQGPPGALTRIIFILRMGVRSGVLFLKFGPLLLLYPLTFVSAGLASLWLRLLLKATETSGPACIKLGQWASTRRDLFSEDFCNLFSKLHVKVTPHPWEYTERCLHRAFGTHWNRVLRFHSREPVGSGCVAQVYKAHADLSTIGQFDPQALTDSYDQEMTGYEAWEVPGLTGILGYLWEWRKKVVPSDRSGRASDQQQHPQESTLYPDGSDTQQLIPVAVKVLHPGLTQHVRMDILLMKTWSRLIGWIPGFRWLSLTEMVEEFEKLMTHQIDLRSEARNLELFRQKFDKVDFIRFPTPLRPLVTRNILVETFEDGEPVSLYLREPDAAPIKQRIAGMGVDMLLKMIFTDNFVHADLHPGNILVQGVHQYATGAADQTTLVDMCDTLIVDVRPVRCPLRLVVLDAGIVAQLQEKDLQNLRAVFTAVLLGQGETVAELILHHARANQCTDVEGYKKDMAELVTEARKTTVALGKLQVAVLLSRVFQILMTYKVKLESNFASVIFAVMVLEGLGRSLDPEVDILEAARPLLLKNAASLLT
ncbi:hypothetical protein XENTR_v10007642 [Xenopus tropicalis]|uniref:AarF domain containing kinase 2 n=1 Tax=Xenopus tropicalis TaxID=8364 RepID=A0A803K9D1_XENTR|nr:uncharacterized aarF domain-containing protein kinase 2 [Xenopus tropicalis]KAE8613255.1 hypothetical protein XENTR_v10007642 [Xenopus tropicalis]